MNDLSATSGKGNRTPVVYLVDDEDIVITSIRALLELETDYIVKSFVSPAEALSEMKKTAPDIVISDFLMPEMDGLRFLESVKQLFPEVPLVLLTGYADKENAIKGINRIGLYQYIEKPWDNENLQLVIRNGINSRSLKITLNEKVRELDKVIRTLDGLSARDQLMSRELKLAQQLQRKLLPDDLFASEDLVVDAAYHPAFEVGGDFYDIIRLDQNRFALLVADATGHGIQAALSTALLKFAFRSFAGQHLSPAEIMIGMNDIFHKGLPSEIFIAGLVAVVDTRSYDIHIVNGGLPHPVWLNSESGEAERVPAEGLLLGVADAAIYEPGEDVRVSLTENSRLLFLTDGITESENKSGEHFETSRLLSSVNEAKELSNGVMIEQIVDRAKSFHDSEYGVDDITLLSIERLENRR